MHSLQSEKSLTDLMSEVCSVWSKYILKGIIKKDTYALFFLGGFEENQILK